MDPLLRVNFNSKDVVTNQSCCLNPQTEFHTEAQRRGEIQIPIKKDVPFPTSAFPRVRMTTQLHLNFGVLSESLRNAASHDTGSNIFDCGAGLRRLALRIKPSKKRSPTS